MITWITYHCPTSMMGDEATEEDAEGYRAWVRGELERKFPGTEVTVTDREETFNLVTDVSGDEEGAWEWEELHWFVSDCWDRCRWEWVRPAYPAGLTSESAYAESFGPRDQARRELQKIADQATAWGTEKSLALAEEARVYLSWLEEHETCSDMPEEWEPA